MVHIYNTPGTFQEFIFLIFTCELEEKRQKFKKFNYKSNDKFMHKDAYQNIFK